MNKVKNNLIISGILVISLMSITASAWILMVSGKIDASERGKCTNECPNGKEVTCNGSRVETIDDPKDPGCKCDGKEYRCSDLDKNSNTNTNNKNPENKDKKKKNENSSHENNSSMY